MYPLKSISSPPAYVCWHVVVAAAAAIALGAAADVGFAAALW